VGIQGVGSALRCWTFVGSGVYRTLGTCVGPEFGSGPQMFEIQVDHWETFADLPFVADRKRYQATSSHQRCTACAGHWTYQDASIVGSEGICVFTPGSPLCSITRSGRRRSGAHGLSFCEWYRRDVAGRSDGDRVIPGNGSLHQRLHPFPHNLLLGRREEMRLVAAD
jgi:hypothetical protein